MSRLSKAAEVAVRGVLGVREGEEVIMISNQETGKEVR